MHNHTKDCHHGKKPPPSTLLETVLLGALCVAIMFWIFKMKDKEPGKLGLSLEVHVQSSPSAK